MRLIGKRVTEMAGVTFCFSSSSGAFSCPPNFIALPRWRSSAFAYPTTLQGHHCSKISSRYRIKRILYSESSRRPFVVAAAEVPDFPPATWAKPNKPIGPKFDVKLVQVDALMDNDIPYGDHGVEVMYRNHLGASVFSNVVSSTCDML